MRLVGLVTCNSLDDKSKLLSMEDVTLIYNTVSDETSR